MTNACDTTAALPATPRPGVPPLAILALAGAMGTIGIGNSLAQTLFPAVGPLGAVALRNVFGAAMLLAIYRPFGRSRPRFTRHSLAMIAGYGVMLGVMNELFYTALQTIPLGLAVAVEFTGPLLVAVLSSRRATDFAWVGLAIIGLALITPEIAHLLLPGAAAMRQAADWRGLLFALGAGAAWAGYMLLGSRAGASHGGGAAALGMAVATIVSLPIGLAQNGFALFAPHLLPQAIAVAFLAGAFPYALEMYALARMPARNYGMLVSVEPAVSALAGFLMLGQRLSALQMLAVALLITASAGATLSARPRKPGSDDHLPVEGPV